MVPARRKSQKLILFGQIKSELMSCEESKSKNEPPQFTHYELNVLRMMENIGYDLANGPGLNFSKGRRILLRSFVPKGKTPDYYHQTRRGWAMYQLQFRQPLSLKSYYTITTHLARHRGS